MDAGAIHILNLNECEEIVRNACNLPPTQQVNIQKYAVEKGSSMLIGYMGAYFKLKIYLEDQELKTKELQCFVKSVPIFDRFQKDECERKGFFFKETSIYNNILPHIQSYAKCDLFAKCYYTRPDLMVLEDLTTCDFKHVAEKESYTMHHDRIFLTHLAKLHSASLAWEHHEQVNIGESFKKVLLEMQLTMNNEWYITGIKGIMFLANMHPKFQSNDAKEFINNKLYDILSKAEELTKPSTQFRNVLCHRDSWNHNIFFKFNASNEPIECRIVDFQLTRYSTPAIDVLFYLYMTNNPKRQENIIKDCLNFYYNALVACLKEQNLSPQLISRAEFDMDCQRSLVAILILCAICEPLTKMPQGLSNKLRNEDPKKFDSYMNSDRSELFTRVMQLSDAYRHDIMSSIEELLNYLIENKHDML